TSSQLASQSVKLSGVLLPKRLAFQTCLRCAGEIFRLAAKLRKYLKTKIHSIDAIIAIKLPCLLDRRQAERLRFRQLALATQGASHMRSRHDQGNWNISILIGARLG